MFILVLLKWSKQHTFPRINFILDLSRNKKKSQKKTRSKGILFYTAILIGNFKLLKIIIRPQPQLYIEKIVECPRKPPPRIIDQEVIEKAPPPIVKTQLVRKLASFKATIFLV